MPVRKQCEPRFCVECNGPIVRRRYASREESFADYTKRLYCTVQCAANATQRRLLKARGSMKVIEERTCLECERPFTPTRRDGAEKRVYCTRRCSEKAQAERSRLARLAKRSDNPATLMLATGIRPATKVRLAFLESPPVPKSEREQELGL
jgi:hypothetical protein